MDATVQQTSEDPETPTQLRQASPVSNLSSSSGSTLSEAESAVADNAVTPPVAMLAEGGNTTETPAPARSLSLSPEAATRNASHAETLATGTNLTETAATSQTSSQISSSTRAPEQTNAQSSVPSQNPSQDAESNLNSSEISATSPVPPPIFVSGQSRAHFVAPKPNSIQVAAPSLNPLSQVASQSLTPATASSTNPTETQETSTNSTPISVPNLNLTSTFVQGQEQVLTQQQNQNVNVIVSPMPGDGLNPPPMTVSAAATQSGQRSAQPTVQSKSGSTSGGKTSTPESIHGNSNSVQHASPLVVGQSSAPAVDTSSMTRALAGTGGTVNTSDEPARASRTAATGPDSREAFATLDAASAPVATTWIHAGTQRAEAGYQDSVLGWVGVRADLSGGGVHAQLVPGSADAAQALDGHLAGLNAYLAEHHTPVETLTLTTPESGWSGMGSGQSAGEGMQQGAGQQSAQGADASTLSGQSTESAIQPPAASAELPAFFGDMNGNTQPASLDGYHISVMA